MLVEYDFDCMWDSNKKERISYLLSERVSLLAGSRTYQKIEKLSFCDKEAIQNKSTYVYFFSGDNYAIVNVAGTLNTKVYELIFEKDILLSMLKPGEGQAQFDSLMLELKDAIQ